MEAMMKQLQSKLGMSNQQFLKLQQEHKTTQQQYTALLKELDTAKEGCDTKLGSIMEENKNLKKQVGDEGGQIKALKGLIKGELIKLQKHVE